MLAQQRTVATSCERHREAPLRELMGREESAAQAKEAARAKEAAAAAKKAASRDKQWEVGAKPTDTEAAAKAAEAAARAAAKKAQEAAEGGGAPAVTQKPGGGVVLPRCALPLAHLRVAALSRSRLVLSDLRLPYQRVGASCARSLLTPRKAAPARHRCTSDTLPDLPPSAKPTRSVCNTLYHHTLTAARTRASGKPAARPPLPAGC